MKNRPPPAIADFGLQIRPMRLYASGHPQSEMKNLKSISSLIGGAIAMALGPVVYGTVTPRFLVPSK
jgi:hypothetical protein